MKSSIFSEKSDKKTKTLMKIILLCLLIVGISTAQPTCTWECDNPTCFAVCQPVCKPPSCIWDCPNGIPSSVCGKPPSCFIECPDPVTNASLQSCPACTTKCASITCTLAGGIQCPIVCPESQCSWACKKPDSCQAPRCELQCNTAAC